MWYTTYVPVVVSTSVELMQLVMGLNSSIVVQLATTLLRKASVLLLLQVQVLQDSVITETKQ